MGPNWQELSSQIKEELTSIFGSRNNAKMTMKRKDFALFKNEVLYEHSKFIEYLLSNSDPVFEFSAGNNKFPYVISMRCIYPSAVGTLYEKNSENKKLSSKELNGLSLCVNVSDIVGRILLSNEQDMSVRRNDWDRRINGYIATLTPDES